MLEIGCGGGQWSKFMYEYVDKLYCVDILSSDHNQFWENVGKEKKDKMEKEEEKAKELEKAKDG